MATAVKNALRYVPEKHHAGLAPEFLNELLTHGREQRRLLGLRDIVRPFEIRRKPSAEPCFIDDEPIE